jgi:hypothetical protein
MPLTQVLAAIDEVSSIPLGACQGLDPVCTRGRSVRKMSASDGPAARRERIPSVLPAVLNAGLRARVSAVCHGGVSARWLPGRCSGGWLPGLLEGPARAYAAFMRGDTGERITTKREQRSAVELAGGPTTSVFVPGDYARIQQDARCGCLSSSF